jgi:hypothetical protein
MVRSWRYLQQLSYHAYMTLGRSFRAVIILGYWRAWGAINPFTTPNAFTLSLIGGVTKRCIRFVERCEMRRVLAIMRERLRIHRLQQKALALWMARLRKWQEVIMKRLIGRWLRTMIEYYRHPPLLFPTLTESHTGSGLRNGRRP